MIRNASVLLFLSLGIAGIGLAQKVDVHWDDATRMLRTTATLQVVVNPPLRRGSKIHDRVFSNLRTLGAEYVRYVPWLPYPRLGVAELEPPANGKTSWDFSLIDPMTVDFLNATKGHKVILNFSTIPAWMFKTPKPVAYPDDPNQIPLPYHKGATTRLAKPSSIQINLLARVKKSDVQPSWGYVPAKTMDLLDDKVKKLGKL